MSNFYTGAGVLNFGGKDYGYGEELPSGIPKETIDSLKEKKHICDAPPTAATAATASDTGALKDQIAMLTAKVEGLTEELEGAAIADKELVDRLTAAQTEIVRLNVELTNSQGEAGRLTTELHTSQAEVARLNGTIEEMTSQMMKPAVADAAAGPAKK